MTMNGRRLTPVHGGMSRADIETIERFANKNLNYEGAEFNYEGADIGNEYDFGGRPGGFANELAADVSFSFTLANQGAAAVNRIIALSPGIFTAEAAMQDAGYLVDGILKDGGVIPGAAADAQVTATSNVPRRSINSFLEFVKRNPTRLVEIHLQADDPSQFDTNLNLSTFSPFRDLGQDYIRLQDWYDPDQFSSKKIEIQLLKSAQDFQFDDQQIATMQLLAGRRVTMTLFFGGINNQAKKLAVRAKRFHAGHAARIAAVRSAAK